MTTAAKAMAEGLEGPEAGEFSLVFLPDTQEYAQYYPGHFLAQTQWVADHRERFNIRAVLHEGDVVNRSESGQWAQAEAAMRVLDEAGIPYLVAIGNHDYDVQGDADRCATGFNAMFSPERYAAHGWWQGGFYEAGHTENAYCRLPAEGRNLLLLSLEFGPRQAVIDWAGDVLRRHADHFAILLTHSYLYIDGTRVSAGDAHNPKLYALGATAHDGEDLWAKLVSVHDNLRWVQSGHHLGGNTAYRSDRSLGGTLVHQAFANWQAAPNGGDGWMQMLTIGPDRARVQTFSPTLGVVGEGAGYGYVVALGG
jgi:hypothetical protein